jgi:DNA-binding IclR family transcriptional regulator
VKSLKPDHKGVKTVVPSKKYVAPAVMQASDILFCLAASPEPQMSLLEISGHVGISGSKAFGILEALQESDLVKRGKDGKGYALGLGLVSLSRKVLDDLTPSQLAQPILDELARETKSTAVLGLISRDTVYVAAKRESDGDIRVVTHLGRTTSITHGAHGKAIVAFLSADERERILKGPALYFQADPKKTDKERLNRELSECRKNGFSYDFGELVPGVSVVAAPVLGAGSAPIGYVEVFILAPVETAVAFGPTVARAGKLLSQQLGHSRR